MTKIVTQPRGRPPILLELDDKLLKLLLAIRAKGGIINVHVVRATTKALIDSNPGSLQLSNFKMPRSWVHSVYRRMGFTRRMRTTTWQPVPKGLFTAYKRDYLHDVKEKN